MKGQFLESGYEECHWRSTSLYKCQDSSEPLSITIFERQTNLYSRKHTSYDQTSDSNKRGNFLAKQIWHEAVNFQKSPQC